MYDTILYLVRMCTYIVYKVDGTRPDVLLEQAGCLEASWKYKKKKNLLQDEVSDISNLRGSHLPLTSPTMMISYHTYVAQTGKQRYSD